MSLLEPGPTEPPEDATAGPGVAPPPGPIDLTRRSPAALQVIALVWLWSGATAAWSMARSLGSHEVNLSFGVIGLAVGIGLWRHRARWRTVALAMSWIAFLALPVFANGVLTVGSLTVSIGSRVRVETPPTAEMRLLGLGLTAAFALVVLWQYSVLTRRDVVALFAGQPPDNAEGAGGGGGRLG